MKTLEHTTWTNNRKNKVTGDVGEEMAVKFLQEKGIRVLQRNYRFDRGEIDIVAEDNGEIVFVEVKSRHSHSFGTPEDAITPAKESHLKRTAEGYLLQRGIEGKPCRFDAITIQWESGQPQIRHLKRVF